MQGWGNSTTEEQQVELYVRGGELHGNVIGGIHTSTHGFLIIADNLADQIEARHMW